jgi:hypothetical protein
MKGIRKYLKYSVLAAVFFGALSGCDLFLGFDDRPSGNVTLHLGPSPAASRALSQDEIDNLRYEVEFRGPGGALIIRTVAPGTGTLSLSLALGGWTISAEAYAGEDLAGTGGVTVTVAAGGVTVSIPMKEAAKKITAFNITDPVTVSGIVDEDTKTIAIEVPHGTDVTAMIASITHTGVSISPASGAAADFSSPVTYTVTAENGAQRLYIVTVSPRTGQTVISITGPEDEDITIKSGGTPLDSNEPISISRAAGGTLTVTIDDPDYTGGVSWYIDGVSKGNADSLAINAADYLVKEYALLVLVDKDGIFYSRTIYFNVTR